MGKNHDQTCESLRMFLDAETVMVVAVDSGEEIAVAGDVNLARTVCQLSGSDFAGGAERRRVNIVDTGTEIVTCAVGGTEMLTMVAIYTHNQTHVETHLDILTSAAELLEKTHLPANDTGQVLDEKIRDSQTGLLTLEGLRAASETVFDQAQQNDETVSVAVIEVGIVVNPDVGVSTTQSDAAIKIMVDRLLPAICRTSDLVARTGEATFAVLFAHGYVPVEAIRARAAVAVAAHNRLGVGDQLSLAVGAAKTVKTGNLDDLIEVATDWAKSDRAARRGTVSAYR